jgi:hypothetical protein
MARYNEILVGRFNRALQKMLAMKGEPPAPQLSTEIQPSHVFFSGVENRYVESWDRFGNRAFQTGVAAQFSQCRLRNPPTSNVVAVIEKLNIENTLAFEYVLQLQPLLTDLAVIASAGVAFDNRGRGNGAMVLSQTTAVAVPSTFLILSVAGAANETLDLVRFDDQELPLLPGMALTLTQSTALSTLVANLWWRERFLEDSERT